MKVLNETILSGKFNPEDIVRIKHSEVVKIDGKKAVKFDVSYDSDQLDNIILQAKILASKIVGYEEEINSIQIDIPKSQTTTVTIPLEANSVYDFFQTISIARVDENDAPVNLSLKNIRIESEDGTSEPFDLTSMSQVLDDSLDDKKDNGASLPAVLLVLFMLLQVFF